MSAPLIAYLPVESGMIATEVATPFLTPFKLSFFAAIFIGMPVLLHQAWAFVSPGLYLHEKRFAVPLLASSILLFYAGTAFAYFLVFPLVFQFFTSVTPDGVTMMTDISRYLDFVLKMFFCVRHCLRDSRRDPASSVDGPGNGKWYGLETPLRCRRLFRGRHAPHPSGRDISDLARATNLAVVRAGGAGRQIYRAARWWRGRHLGLTGSHRARSLSSYNDRLARSSWRFATSRSNSIKEGVLQMVFGIRVPVDLMRLHT